MSDAEKELERLRADRAAIAAEIKSKASHETRLLMEYIDAKHAEKEPIIGALFGSAIMMQWLLK